MKSKRNFLLSYLEDIWIIFNSSVFVKHAYLGILFLLCKFEKMKFNEFHLLHEKLNIELCSKSIFIIFYLHFRIYFPVEAML